MDHETWQELLELLWAKIGNSLFPFLQGAGLGVNDLNQYGTTMLSCAADNVNERMEFVKHLVEIGADVNVTNSDGSKPLHAAAKHGHTNMAKFFLSLGVNVDSRDNEDNTPLHYLVQETDVSIYTRGKHQELVHFLLDSNANLNAVNKEGRTPLLLAAQNLRKDLVELLIRLGASVDCCDKGGWTVLHHSSQKGWLGVVRSLVEGDFNIDLNARTSAGATSLRYAAAFSHFSVAEYLFESGADVQTCLIDKGRNLTALHMACWNGSLDEVKCFVKMGSQLNAKSSTGATPLLMAVRKSHLSVVEYLIDSGADVNSYGRFDNTVLHDACRYRDLNTVKALTKKGANLNSQNYKGDTPLHDAVDLIDLEIAKHLLEAGADFNVKNIYGKSAFNRILEDNPIRLKAISIFLEKGAYFQSEDIATMFFWGILKDWKLCTQTIINKFNNADLLKIYKMPAIAKRLPSIEKLKIVSDTNTAQVIEQSVRDRIQSIGYCNFVFKVPPLTLSILSVKALLKYYM